MVDILVLRRNDPFTPTYTPTILHIIKSHDSLLSQCKDSGGSELYPYSTQTRQLKYNQPTIQYVVMGSGT